MAATKYTFSIQNDFPNHKVAIDALASEIGTSLITKALDYINTNADVCDVWFKAQLSSGEEVYLVDIVSQHQGVSLVQVDKVEVVKSPSESVINIHKKLEVHESSRIPGTRTYYTGAGDDPTNIMDVGSGNHFILHHRVGDPAIQYLYLHFNIAENDTWIHEGYVIWDEAKFDSVSFEIVPNVVSGVISSGTFFNVYGGYLVVPAAGDGTFQLTSDITQPHGGLVHIPADYDGQRQALCFWNADWNSTTKKYENISAAPLGNGNFNMFTQEITLSRFVNRIPLVGSGFEMMQSADADRLGQGMVLRAKMETIQPDHDWTVACIMTLHRARTA